MFSRVPKVLVAVFPHIVSEETILFLNLEIVEHSDSCSFLPQKLFKGGNHSRAETL